MDAFIEKLDLQRLGFVCRVLNAEGDLLVRSAHTVSN